MRLTSGSVDAEIGEYISGSTDTGGIIGDDHGACQHAIRKRGQPNGTRIVLHPDS